MLFSCINDAFYNGSQHDLKEGAAGKGSMLLETTRKFNEAFKFGIPNDVAGFLGPLGWDASADGAVKDVKDTYKVRSHVKSLSFFDSRSLDIASLTPIALLGLGRLCRRGDF